MYISIQSKWLNIYYCVAVTKYHGPFTLDMQKEVFFWKISNLGNSIHIVFPLCPEKERSNQEK